MADVRHAESADGTRVAYRTAGSGEPLVLVHGSATSSADWAFVTPILAGRFTVVAMDRRGRGQSDDGPEYAMEREAEDILAVVEAVDAQLLVGHSYGGLCSTLAAERTDRLRRLVLYEPPIAVRAERVRGIDQLVAGGDLDVALEGFLRAVGISPDQLSAIRSSQAWPVLLDAVPALPREMQAAVGWRPPRDPVDVPLLLLHGADTRNRVYLDGLDELEAAFPDARRCLIPGQQHVAHVFAPREFADVVTEFCA